MYRGGTRTLREEDLNVFSYTGDTLDIGRVALEEVIVRIPPKRLCSPDCKGLCPVCGANRNEVDCGHSIEGIRPFGVIDEEILSELESYIRKASTKTSGGR